MRDTTLSLVHRNSRTPREGQGQASSVAMPTTGQSLTLTTARSCEAWVAGATFGLTVCAVDTLASSTCDVWCFSTVVVKVYINIIMERTLMDCGLSSTGKFQASYIKINTLLCRSIEAVLKQNLVYFLSKLLKLLRTLAANPNLFDRTFHVC